MFRRFRTMTHTPVGELTLIAHDDAIAGIYLTDHRHRPTVATDGEEVTDDSLLVEATRQLEEYFNRERQTFELPLHSPGTPFQQSVWQALSEIPYGQTWSYGQLAAHVGAPKASRAVGLANGRNPISIVVPCHRVIGSTGAITGYGGGVQNKQWLLAHEQLGAAAPLF